jgi:hypothetical protein
MSSSGPTIGMTRRSSMKLSRSSHASSSRVASGSVLAAALFVHFLAGYHVPAVPLLETLRYRR